MNPQRHAIAKNGMTLLEVVIASGLIASLMVIVWSLFSIYSKLNERGIRQATELQLVRSLVRQIRTDVAQARFSFPPPKSDAISSVVLEDVIPLPLGAELVGSQTTLRVVVPSLRRGFPNRPNSFRPDESVKTFDVYDVVQYDWTPSELPDLFGELQAEPRLMNDRDSDLQEEPGDTGLTRQVTPWYALNPLALEETRVDRRTPRGSKIGDINDLPDERNPINRWVKVRDHVPEVSRLRFRYFDGMMWRGEWDSNLEKRFPVAIEVAFDIFVQDEKAEEDGEIPDNEAVLTKTIDDENGAAKPVDRYSLVEPSDQEDESVDDLTRDLEIGLDGEFVDYEYKFVISVEPLVSSPPSMGVMP